jgi:DNA-binding cell septation regulator SpoVG
MSAAIEVLEVRPVPGAGNLKAFVKVKLGCVVISSCRIIQQPARRAWVSLPQQKSGDKWYPTIEISNRAVLDQVREAVLAAWEAGR